MSRHRWRPVAKCVILRGLSWDWRRSQVVRQRTANPLFGGSNPPGASSPSVEDLPPLAKRAWRNWKTLGT